MKSPLILDLGLIKVEFKFVLNLPFSKIIPIVFKLLEMMSNYHKSVERNTNIDQDLKIKVKKSIKNLERKESKESKGKIKMIILDLDPDQKTGRENIKEREYKVRANDISLKLIL